MCINSKCFLYYRMVFRFPNNGKTLFTVHRERTMVVVLLGIVSGHRIGFHPLHSQCFQIVQCMLQELRCYSFAAVPLRDGKTGDNSHLIVIGGKIVVKQPDTR